MQTVRGIGVVMDEPRELETTRNVAHSRFTVRLESIAAETERTTRAMVAVVWAGEMPRYGDRLAFAGDIRSLDPPRNPGQFDYAALSHRRGIFSEIHLRYPTDGRVLAHDCGNPVIAFAHRARDWMQKTLTEDLRDSPEVAGLAQSLVLGLKDETPPETREMFQRTGTLHLFVVNGLHVGMFGLIAWFLLRPLGVTRRMAVFVIVPLLGFYALVTGLSPGSVRAAVMAAILLSGTLVERPPLPFNSLATAAFFLLLWDTNELFMPGFQFSFGVVFTIILLAGIVQRRIVPWARPDPFLPRLLWNRWQVARTELWQRVAALLAVTTSASIGSAPFTATYFHLLSPSALAANLVMVPLALILLFEGVLALLGGCVAVVVSTVFNNVMWVFAHAILGTVQFFAALPGGHIFVENPRHHAQCEVTIFDLAGGGAVHVRTGGRDWLLDCGNAFAYESAVRPFLRSRGVNHLDGFLLTHGDVAHIGAAGTVLADFRPSEIYDSPLRDRSQNRRAFHALLESDQLGKSICAAGDVLEVSDEVRARVLYPTPGVDARTADDKALVLQLEAFGTRLLFVSDSGFFTELWLREHAPDLHSDILVKGAHASDLSGTPDFLGAVHPRVVICSGAGFPPAEQVREDWAGAVREQGIALFRQDKIGAVEIAIDRDQWTARAFLGNDSFTSHRQ
ncbi:MAG: competence protein ComEC [Chthoniobacter sp.]|nr:competence protein ComEC [Chthoniobacter sp.]